MHEFKLRCDPVRSIGANNYVESGIKKLFYSRTLSNICKGRAVFNRFTKATISRYYSVVISIESEILQDFSRDEIIFASIPKLSSIESLRKWSWIDLKVLMM